MDLLVRVTPKQRLDMLVLMAHVEVFDARKYDFATPEGVLDFANDAGQIASESRAVFTSLVAAINAAKRR